MMVVGIDPSLTSTGVVVVDAQDRLTVQTATVESRGARSDSWASRSERVRGLAASVTAEVPVSARLVVMESPSLSQRNAGSAHDRAGLWWAIYWRLTDRGIPVLPVPPAVRAKYAAGKGNAAKDAVMLAVARRYPHVDIGNNNEADAMVLAAIGARLLGEPVEDSLPKTHTDALQKVTLP